MLRRIKLGIVSVLLAWMLVSLAYGGVADEWLIKERLDVTVTSTETEIMESTLTDKKYNRKFSIDNGDNEIVVTVWGSNDEETWEEMKIDTIPAETNEWLILGSNHYWYIQLTGHTTGEPGQTSVVGVFLYYRAV